MKHNNDVPGIILPCALTLILYSRLVFVPANQASHLTHSTFLYFVKTDNRQKDNKY